ncbi:MAG: ATP-binding protein [Leptospiraceae bacterium]|nr:ATP-binding protein [Leptospiraceae bacterium]
MQIEKKFSCFIALFLIFSVNHSIIADSLKLQTNTELLSVKDKIFYLEDVEGKFTLDDILSDKLQKKFQIQEVEFFSKPATRSVFWFKIKFQNFASEDAWLQFASTFGYYLDFYSVDETGKVLNKVLTGSLRDKSSRAYDTNWFWFPLNEANETNEKTYYLRVYEESPFEAPLQIGTIRSLTSNKVKNDYLTAGYVGVMLTLIFYNLFIYISTREKLYALYICYLISFLFTPTFLNGYSLVGYLGSGLLEEGFWFKKFILWQSQVYLASGLFCIEFLNLKTNLPKIRKLIIFEIFILSFILPLLNIFIDLVDLINIYQIIIFIFYITCISSAYYLVTKGNKNAIFYSFGWTFFVIGILTFLLVVNNMLPFHFVLRNANYIGVAIEGIIFSFGLIHYISNLKKEKEEAIKLSIEKAKENEILVLEQNKKLEDKVKERTLELEKQKEELEHFNQLLRTSEKELVEAKEKAQDSSNSKSIFLANMSHEIRTPINGILGMSKILRDSSLSKGESEYVGAIIESSQNLLGIINDILDFSKIEAGKIELEEIRFNLQELVKSVQKTMLFAVGEKNIQLKLEGLNNLERTYNGDPVRIRQILINLVNNAIKFTEIGEVKIKLSVISSSETNSRIRFEIIDTGIGVDEETIQKMFAPFTQADSSTARKFGGTGLGLSISKFLVELMGGEIGVTSKPNIGSNFWFEINLLKGKEISETQVIHKHNEDSVKKIEARVLLAEDNQINQLVAQKFLEKIGINPVIVDNGEQVLRILEEAKFDLILMDCQMPILDGFETTLRIRKSGKSYSNIPIIAMTANAMKEDRDLCIEKGMNDYIAKPYEIETLVEVLEKWFFLD